MSSHRGPRLAIIPAGAITDPELTPRALQVLCLLGRHTDRNGWCRVRQTLMAEELRCARSTIQAALELLYARRWVERRLEGRPGGAEPDPEKQPYASHAYRVILDVPDVENAAVHAATFSEGVPDPSGTPAEGGARPIGHGVPIHTSAPNERPFDNESEIYGSRAREGLISDEAQKVADDCIIALGLEPTDPPPELYGLPYQIQIMLARGYDRPRIVAAFARFAGRRPIKPLSYFVKVVETECTAQPLAPPSSPEVGNGAETIRNGYAGRISPRQDLRSAKERRYAQAWHNVESALGLTGTHDDRAGEKIDPPPAGGLAES